MAQSRSPSSGRSKMRRSTASASLSSASARPSGADGSSAASLTEHDMAAKGSPNVESVAEAAAAGLTPVTTAASAVMTGSTLRQRYLEVKKRISSAALRCGRSPAEIHLLAVTKHAAPEQIRELMEMGHADFGENRVQNLVRRVALADEFLERHRTLTSSRSVSIPAQVRWHLIGHLQRNKVRKALDLVTLVHSVDTLRLAEEIQDAAIRRDKPVDILLQVNASFEKTKSGVALPAAAHLAEQIDSMVHLRLRGLMTMAPLTDDPEPIRSTFERCAEAFDEIRRLGIGGETFNILSMGMTNDFEVAIECGANLVRIGTAIFGENRLSEEPDEDDEKESGVHFER